MKMIFMSLIMIVLLAGCAVGSSEEDVHVLDEHFFGTQIMELFHNTEDFLGRTIRYEGILTSFDSGAGEDIFVVYRYEDGCCGPEPVGLEVFLSGIEPFPNDTWVEVTGIFSEFERGGHTGLRLNVTRLIETN